MTQDVRFGSGSGVEHRRAIRPLWGLQRKLECRRAVRDGKADQIQSWAKLCFLAGHSVPQP